MKNWVIIILINIVLLYSNCKTKNKISINIIEQGIDSLTSKCCVNKLNDYIVYPKFMSFQFDNFLKKSDLSAKNLKLKDKTKKEILKKLNLNNTAFDSIKKKVDERYNNKYSDYLKILSKKDSSNFVFYVSGLSENIFFIDMVGYHKKKSKNNIKTPDYRVEELYDVFSFILLVKNNKIDTIMDGTQISFN